MSPVRFIPPPEPEGDDPVSITCPKCDLTSYHPDDVATGYCGACHAFTSVPSVTYADDVVIDEQEGRDFEGRRPEPGPPMSSWSPEPWELR